MFEDYVNNDLATKKQANQVEYCTRTEFEARIKAIAKSKRDIAWWAEKFFRIIPTSGGLLTIKLYDKQKELLRHLVDNDRSIVLASRLVGKCVFKDTTVSIKNKKTGEIQTISIELLFNIIKQNCK